MKDPERYLKGLQIALPCAVLPARRAVLDSTLRFFVNHEVFFFSSRKALERFRKEPFRYCGIVTDPVSRLRFTPSADSPLWEYRGRTYYFLSDSMRVAFQAMPDSFALRRGM